MEHKVFIRPCIDVSLAAFGRKEIEIAEVYARSFRLQRDSMLIEEPTIPA